MQTFDKQPFYDQIRMEDTETDELIARTTKRIEEAKKMLSSTRTSICKELNSYLSSQDTFSSRLKSQMSHFELPKDSEVKKSKSRGLTSLPPL